VRERRGGEGERKREKRWIKRGREIERGKGRERKTERNECSRAVVPVKRGHKTCG